MDDVAGHQTLLSQFAGGDVARETVQVHADEAGILSFVTSGQQSGDDTSEHVATARRRHTGIAGRVEDDVTVGETEGRVMTFENHIALNPLGEAAGFGKHFVTVVTVTL